MALACLTVWLLLPFWSIATLRTINVQDDIFTSDLLNDRLPCRAFVGGSLKRGEPPFWMPGVYTGFPALAAIEIGALYPSNLLLFGLLPPYAAIAYAQLLPLFIAGLGTFVLARKIGLPWACGLLAAGAFSLSGFFVCHLRQLNMVDAASWIPFLLVGVEQALGSKAGRAPLLLAVVWALQLLAGHPQVSYFTALILVAYLLVRWRQIDRQAHGNGWLWPARFLRDSTVWKIGLAILLGTLAAAAQLLPATELAFLSHRQGGFSFDQASMLPAPPQSLWTFLLPYWNGDPGLDTYRLSGIFWEQYGYVGLVPVFLALAVVFAKWRDPIVRLFAIIILASSLMFLGRNTPLFYLAYRIVPGMSYFRFPTRFLVFAELGIALLAGFGLRLVLDQFRGRKMRAAIAVVALAVTLADLWIHQMRQVPQVKWEEWTSPIGSERFLAAERARSTEPWRYYALDSTAVHTATFHAAHGWAGNLDPYVRLRAMLQPSFNLLFGLESPDGYVNLAPRSYEAIWGSEKQPGLVRPSGESRGGRWWLKPEMMALLRLFNVRYIIASQPVASAGLTLAAETAEGARIYEVSDPLPRAFVVGKVTLVENEEKALARLRSPDFDPRVEGIVDAAAFRLPTDAASSKDVTIIARQNLEVTMRAKLDRPGLLVLSEGYYPGWRATVDGVETPIVRANLMMRAVAVPAGEHEVRFEFRSRSIAAGFLISLIGVIGIWLARRTLLTVRGKAESPLGELRELPS